MVDLAQIRKDPELFVKACADKGINFDVHAFLALDEQVKSARQKVEELRRLQNQVSEEMPNTKGLKINRQR